MSEKGQGAGPAGATPGGRDVPLPPESPPKPFDGGDPAPVPRRGGGGQKADQSGPKPKPPSGTIEFPDGGRLTGEGGEFTYTDPQGRTGQWKDGGWVDPTSGKGMPDDFRGRAPDPSRVRERRDW